MTNPMPGCVDFRASRRISRRGMLEAGSLAAISLGLMDLLALRARAAENRAASESPAATLAASDGRTPLGAGFGRAKRCIFVFAWGGPSQLDTWDPKPQAPAEIRGPFAAISTKAPGVQISEHFPRLAQVADKYAIVRSVTHDDPAHLSSVHHLLTGRHAPHVKSDKDPPSRDDWPHLGSMLAKLRHADGPMPPFVSMPWYVSHPAAPGGVAPGQHAGQLGPGFDPFLLPGDPSAATFRAPGLSLPDDLSLARLESRRALVDLVDHQIRASALQAEMNHFGRLRQEALGMIASPNVREAFNLLAEPESMRDRYGRNIHGQCLLLARRLAESGVPLVCVNWHNDGHNFWDTHGDNFNQLKNRLMPPTDHGFSALLEDLDSRGLLAETLVVWAGEFGRRPRITENNAGREHWPRCYSAVFAGGGVRGGQIVGRSDTRAEFPADNPVSPAHLAATIYHALGVDPGQFVAARDGRPVRLTEGSPITSLFTG